MGFNSLYVGATGLIAQGQWIQSVGSDLSNVSTMAYKRSWVDFESLLSENSPGTGGEVSQIGKGTRVADVKTDFSQGSIVAGTDATDLAIAGQGFFVVKAKGGTGNAYTRAGEFRFDKDGYLCDPAGMVLQGWSIPDGGQSASPQATASNARITAPAGPLGDIRLDSFSIKPHATTSISLITNLDASSEDKAVNTTDPFFAMFKQWTSGSTASPGSVTASYTDNLTIYDSDGKPHAISVSFDPVTTSDSSGNKLWEFMATCDPTEDGRTVGGQSASGTSAGGIMLLGTLSTTNDGKLNGLSAYTLTSGADPTNLSSWSLAKLSADGNPVIPMTFAGASQPNSITLNMGLSNMDTTQGLGTWIGGAQTADGVGASMANLPSFQYRSVSALATTSYSTGSSTIYHGQDGYAEGTLQSIAVDKRGTITGHYSNGQTSDLFTTGLATFTNEWGLRREGGNLYIATPESGSATIGEPTSGNLGSISGRSLESSNVDMGQSMLDLIMAQRGFQADTKIISTVDSLLNTALQLKR